MTAPCEKPPTTVRSGGMPVSSWRPSSQADASANVGRKVPGSGKPISWPAYQCPPPAAAVRSASPARRPDVRQRGQHRLELVAEMLERGRQGQPLAEALERLVRREAGADRRQLEEDAIRLLEVDRLEVEAVDHRG